MTINEKHDWGTPAQPGEVSTGRDDESGAPQSSHALVDRLTAGEPYAVAFGGQGSAWLENLEELVSSAGIESELATLVGEAEFLLEPVAREMVVVRPIGFKPMQWVRALAAEETGAELQAADVGRRVGTGHAAHPDRRCARAEPPGHGSGRDAAGRRGRPLAGRIGRRRRSRPRAPRMCELLALAQLIGTAGTLVARRRGISVLGDRPPMVSVTNADPDRIAELLEEFAQDVRTVLPPVLSIRNGRRSVVITGTPEQLSRFELYCAQIAEKEEAERKNKIRGGAVFSPMFDPVQVEVGFHTPRLSDAIDMVGNWAEKVGLDVGAGPRDGRGHPGAPGGLGQRDQRPPRGGGPLDPRPRTRRHPDPPDGAGHPRPRRWHRARSHPRRSAQPVHRGRRARGGPALVELCARASSACPTAP